MKPGTLLSGDGRPRGITIHNTVDIRVAAGTNAAEQYSRATWPNANMAGVAVHFYIWRRDIWQNLALTEQGWHAGDGTSRRASKRPGERIGGNIDTIAIEAIGEHPETTQTTAMITAWLLREHSLSPETDVYTHNFFMGQPDRIVQGARRNCPLFILPDWEGFQQAMSGYYAGLSQVEPPPILPPPQEDDPESGMSATELFLLGRINTLREKHNQLRRELSELARAWEPE